MARFVEAVCGIHAFNKNQKTAKKDIEIGKQRYQAAIAFRKQSREN